MSVTLEFVTDVLSLNDEFLDYGDVWDSIWWRTDGEFAPVTFMVNCNDLFAWACADCVEITPDNLQLLKQSVTDVRSALGLTKPNRDSSVDDYHTWGKAGTDAALLFCARVRGLRPQRPAYERWFDKRLHSLFDACEPRDEK